MSGAEVVPEPKPKNDLRARVISGTLAVTPPADFDVVGDPQELFLLAVIDLSVVDMREGEKPGAPLLYKRQGGGDRRETRHVAPGKRLAFLLSGEHEWEQISSLDEEVGESLS